MENLSAGKPKFKSKVLVIILSILLCLLLIPLAAGYTLSKTIMQLEFYQEILHEGEFYQQLPSVITETAVQGITENIPPETSGILTKILTKEQLETVLLQILPEGWLESQVDHFLVTILDFVNLRSNQISFEIDLMPIRQNLIGENGKRAVTAMLATLPECNNDHLKNLYGQITSGKFEVGLLCNPPELVYSLFEPLVVSSLANISDSIPGAIVLPVLSVEPGLIETKAQQIYTFYRMVIISFRVLPWVCLGIALLIILFSIRDFKFMLNALGLPLIIGGFASGGLLLLTLKTEENGLSLLTESPLIPTYLAKIGLMIKEIGQSAISRVETQVIVVSAIMIGIGLVLVLIARLFKSRI